MKLALTSIFFILYLPTNDYSAVLPSNDELSKRLYDLLLKRVSEEKKCSMGQPYNWDNKPEHFAQLDEQIKDSLIAGADPNYIMHAFRHTTPFIAYIKNKGSNTDIIKLLLWYGGDLRSGGRKVLFILEDPLIVKTILTHAQYSPRQEKNYNSRFLINFLLSMYTFHRNEKILLAPDIIKLILSRVPDWWCGNPKARKALLPYCSPSQYEELMHHLPYPRLKKEIQKVKDRKYTDQLATAIVQYRINEAKKILEYCDNYRLRAVDYARTRPFLLNACARYLDPESFEKNFKDEIYQIVLNDLNDTAK